MPPEIVLLSLVSMGMATGLGFGILRAINKHLDRKHGSGDARALREELDDVRHQLEGLDDLRDRCSELEERVDFAERLLSQRKDASRLGQGHGGPS